MHCRDKGQVYFKIFSLMQTITSAAQPLMLDDTDNRAADYRCREADLLRYL